MAIINIGQLGERRESALGGFAETLAKSKGKYADALTEAKATKAKNEEARTVKSRGYFREAYKNYWRQPDRERTLFDDTPEGKQFHKTAKKYIPDWYDNESKPIRYPIEREPTPEEENLSKIALEKMKRGLPPTAKEASSVIEVIRKEVMWGGMDEAEGDRTIKYYMQFIKSPFSGAIGGETRAPVNEADPLGILGR